MMGLDWLVWVMVVGPAEKLPESTVLDEAVEAPAEAPAETPTEAPAEATTTEGAPPSEGPSTEGGPRGGAPFEPAASSNRAASATVVTASAAPPPKDKAIRWRFDASLGAGATWVTDDAFLGLSEAPSVLGAAPMLRFDWRLRPGGYLFVGGGAMYRGTRRGGSINDTLQTSLRIDEPVVFARFSLMPIEGFDVFADLGVGPSFTRVDVRDAAFETFATQRNVLVTADLMAGISLYLPKKWLPRKGSSRVTAGVSGSLGYTIRNPLRIAPQIEREDDTLPTATLALGDVTMRGLSWRAGLFVRFM